MSHEFDPSIVWDICSLCGAPVGKPCRTTTNQDSFKAFSETGVRWKGRIHKSPVKAPNGLLVFNVHPSREALPTLLAAVVKAL